MARLDPSDQAPIRGEECLLNHVLGLMRVAEKNAAEPEHRRPVLLEQLSCTGGRPVSGTAARLDKL
jgi:hypothetical protein